MDDWDSISGRDKEFFSLPPCPDYTGTHPAFCPLGTRGSLPGDKAAVKLTTHCHLVPRLRICGTLLPLCTHLHGMVLS
jgi:hypothetical protein